MNRLKPEFFERRHIGPGMVPLEVSRRPNTAWQVFNAVILDQSLPACAVVILQLPLGQIAITDAQIQSLLLNQNPIQEFPPLLTIVPASAEEHFWKTSLRRVSLIEIDLETLGVEISEHLKTQISCALETVRQESGDCDRKFIDTQFLNLRFS